MENQYSAQNVAAYIIYELQEKSYYMNPIQLQQVLRQVDLAWKKVFGHCAFRESTHTHKNYYVKEVFEAYEENDLRLIEEPAREWYLPYGQFQLYYRPYGIPAYTPLEDKVMKKILNEFMTKYSLIAS